MKGECRDWQRKYFFLVLVLGVCLEFYYESHRLSPIIICYVTANSEFIWLELFG